MIRTSSTRTTITAMTAGETWLVEVECTVCAAPLLLSNVNQMASDLVTDISYDWAAAAVEVPSE